MKAIRVEGCSTKAKYGLKLKEQVKWRWAVRLL